MSRPTTRRSRPKLVDLFVLLPIVLLPWCLTGLGLWSFRPAALALVAGMLWILWKEGMAGLGLDLRSSRWLLPALLLAALAGLQLVPLPAFVQRVINPNVAAARASIAAAAETSDHDSLRAFERRALERTGFDLAADDLPEFPLDSGVECFDDWYPASLYPASTSEAFWWYLALLAAFLSVRSRCRSRSVARIYLAAMLASVVGLALFVLLQRLGWEGSFYPSGVVQFGAYINRNHFSGVMELAVPALIGLGWSETARTIRRYRSWAGPGLFAFGGAALCFVAAIVAASKTTAVLLPASVAAMVLLGARNRRQRRTAMILVAALLIVMVSVISLTEVGTRIRAQLDQTELGIVAEGRTGTWIASLPILVDYPVLGIGFGAFSEVYPSYAPVGMNKRWTAAHNDYLEVAVEGGAIAAVLLIWLAGGYAVRVVRSLRNRERGASRRRLGVALGVAALACHAAVDFNHQTPGNALLFVALAALALPALSLPVTRPNTQRRLVLPLALLLLLVYSGRAVEGLIAGVGFIKASTSDRANVLDRAQHLYPIGAAGSYTVRALREAAGVHLDNYDRARRHGHPLDSSDRWHLERAARYFVRLHCQSPASARPLEGLARVYERLQDVATALGAADTPGSPGRVAEGLYRMAADRRPNWYLPYDRLALLFWRHDREAASRQAVYDSATVLPAFHLHRYRRMAKLPDWFREAFIDGSAEALRTNPELRTPVFVMGLAALQHRLGRYKSSLRTLDILEETGTDSVQRAKAAFNRGLTLYRLDRFDEARASFQQAEKHPVFEVAAAAQLARVAEAQGHEDEAMEIRKRLRWLAPERAGPSLEYAEGLRRAGKVEQALATLRGVLGYHPDNVRVRVMLVELFMEQGNLHLAEREIAAMEARGMVEPASRLRARLERLRGLPRER